MQILADVLNTKVEQLESGAGAGYGIALMAASVSGRDVTLEQMVGRTVRTKNVLIQEDIMQSFMK